jgi:1-acyl-sn-glycerol-3-phosphate acyltransferase
MFSRNISTLKFAALNFKMLYWYTYLNLVFLYRAIFKRSFFNGTDNLKQGKPVIIAANHSNAFLDAVLIAAQVNRSVSFLVRSDVFDTAIKRFFLKALHQIPIYRQRDGRDSLQKNEETFKKVYELLEKNNVIMIFPEADCFPEKRLRTLKKGTARMAFGVMEKNNWEIDPYILPVGINYTNHTEMRTEVMVGFDNPISIKDYENLFKENQAKAINQLTNDIAEGIKSQHIHIEKDEENITEKLLQVHRSSEIYLPYLWRRDNSDRLYREKEIVQKVVELKKEKPEEFKKIESASTEYFDLLKENMVSDKSFWAVLNRKKVNLLLYTLFPLLLPFIIILKPVWNWVHQFVKQKIKKDQFKLSMKMGLILGIYHLLYLIVLVSLWPFFGFWVAIGTLFIFWMASWFSILFIEAHRLNLQIWKTRKWKKNYPNDFSNALNLREQIIALIN